MLAAICQKLLSICRKQDKKKKKRSKGDKKDQESEELKKNQ
jgi:hypothetical protein